MSESFEFDVDGVRRTYRLHLPKLASSDPLPMVVFLHGKGGTAEWAEQETGWSDLADRRGFAVLYPEALPPKRDRAPKFLTNPPTWDDSPHSADIAYLNQIPSHAGVDATRVCLSGFSNGAAMAFRLAAERPRTFRAVAPVAGYCRGEFTDLPRTIPTLYLIGDRDPLIPLEGGHVITPWRMVEDRPPIAESLERWGRANRFFPKGVETRDRHGTIWREYLSESLAPMRVGIVHGLGHHWPGGKGGLGEKMGGPIPSALDATETIWEFFQGYI